MDRDIWILENNPLLWQFACLHLIKIFTIHFWKTFHLLGPFIVKKCLKIQHFHAISMFFPQRSYWFPAWNTDLNLPRSMNTWFLITDHAVRFKFFANYSIRMTQYKWLIIYDSDELKVKFHSYRFDNFVIFESLASIFENETSLVIATSEL